jgi:NAD(P)-dependent dehydrogenase (short-subunit alcohol dehydrogenase family)
LAESLLSNEDRKKASAERHPLKRIGDPQEIAGLAQHLLSDEGSWITGQIFYIDGGMSSIRTFR